MCVDVRACWAASNRERQEDTVILRMVDGAKIEMLKAAITDVIPATEEERKKAEKEERPSSAKRAEIEDINQ